MIGKTISHYQILEKLGEGGMGVVYKAEDTRLHRTVALKFIRSEAVEDRELKARFLTEAEAAAALIHPNICVVHEVDEADGMSFIAMEYVEGESLAEKIKQRPLPLEQTLDIGIQIAEGLQAAHEKGIVHRDIKPGNVLLSGRGQAKIMDFGLARLASGTNITKTGTVLGTPAYMSPEQVRGEETDRRTDVWSLGVVLYEMVTGRLPFRGDTAQTVALTIQNQEPEPLTAVRTGVPIALDRIVDKALAKDPAERYLHIDELLVDLRAVSKQLSTRETKPLSSEPVRRRKPHVLTYAGILALGVLLISLGVYLIQTKKAAAPLSPSIAVLPLDNLSGDPEEDYFADGLTDSLITDLAKISSLTVISRTSVMGFKNSTQPLPEIARQLTVDYIVEGSAQRVGDRVRVTAKLIEASSDRNLWAETYDRDARDILALQSEVARTIAREVRARLTPEEEVRLATASQVNIEAHEAYLKGMFYWHRQTAQSVERSIEYFKRAIGLDPDYAPAYAGLSMGYRILVFLGLASGQELLPEAKKAAVKAVELDDTLAEAHATRAASASVEWDWSVAEREFARTLELNPSYAQGYHMFAVLCLAPQGRLDEALHKIQRAVSLDPLSLFNNVQLGQIYYFRREYDQAIKQLRQTLDMDPNYARAHWQLGKTYLAKGMYDEAVAALRRGADLSDDNLARAPLGYACAVSGKKGEARKILEELRERPRGGYVSRCAVAVVYTGLGETDRALEWLESAYSEREAWLIYLEQDPIFDSIRSDHRYHALLRKMNLGD